MDGWAGGWMDGWMGGWVDGWMGGWMDGWMDGRTDGWISNWVRGLSAPIHLGLNRRALCAPYRIMGAVAPQT